MRLILFLLLTSLGGMCCIEVSCAGQSASSPDGAAADSTAAKAAGKMAMPADADSAKVAFRDLRWYTEKDVFYVVGIVDNLALEWHRIWLRLEVQDAAGQPLTINGAPNTVVPTFSDAVPPRGSTSFFHTIPLKHLSGAPANCRLSGAGAVSMPPGPIMIASDLGGVRALRPDPNDPTNIVEQVYQAQAVVENPLDMTAYHPRYVLLIYGQDKLLHFAQLINPELPDTPVRQERQGPIAPREKRQILCPIYYDMLPQALRDTLIQWVDVQIFEARQ